MKIGDLYVFKKNRKIYKITNLNQNRFVILGQLNDTDRLEEHHPQFVVDSDLLEIDYIKLNGLAKVLYD